jgi:poly [ADP-ribose] polymerase 10/14/15
MCSVYSEVDKRTCHVVILAKVLVGEYTLGTKDMYPPPMKPNSMDLFDSTVNNLDNPSIFVTYQDYQVSTQVYRSGNAL